MDYRKVFVRYLQSHDLKLTRSREAILDAVFATHSHFDAEQLYLWMREDKKNVSRATIYRTLPYLVHSGLIRKSLCDEHREEYEHIYGHPNHFHLQCSSCGRIIEQSDEELEKLIKRLAKNNGFSLQDYSIGIKGRCSLCQIEKTDKDKS